MSEEQPKRDEHSELKRLTLATLAPVEEAWNCKVTVMSFGIAAVWRAGGKQLHSVGTVGFAVPKTPHVHVSVAVWTQLRAVADRLKVKSVVFCETPQGVMFAGWAPISGLGYPVAPDPTSGAVICLPKKEFALVERPKEK